MTEAKLMCASDNAKIAHQGTIAAERKIHVKCIDPWKINFLVVFENLNVQDAMSVTEIGKIELLTFCLNVCRWLKLF